MTNDNSVVFKGKKSGIVILLDEDLPFDEIKEIFKDKVLQAKSFFGTSRTSITFKGRALSFEEEKQLIDIISKESGLNISYIDDGYDNKVLNIKDVYDTKHNFLDPFENMTKYHKGSVRSGQSIRYPGSVVVVGDINPGGEIISEGNVTILGSLKGLVHAGCSGNNKCFVTAFAMKPTQLRIADIITYMPSEITKKSKQKFEPSIAYVKEGQIYIAPLL